MSYDYKAVRWKNDANAFRRYLDLCHSFTSEWGKERCRERMRDIQKRWPQYIKEEEIP